MNVQGLSKCLGLIAAVFVLVGCQQPEHSFTQDSVEQASAAAEIVAPGAPVTVVTPMQPPVVMPNLPPVLTAPPATVPQGVSTLCTAFMTTPGPIDLMATEDLDIDHLYQSRSISKPLGTINVNVTSGGLNIQSAVLAKSITVLSGEVRINAQTIEFARSTVGSLCLRADRIVRVSAEGNPTQTLIANKIGSLAITAKAVIHIFNAEVARIDGHVMMKNQICLHEGAKILDFGGNDPGIVDPNCG